MLLCVLNDLSNVSKTVKLVVLEEKPVFFIFQFSFYYYNNYNWCPRQTKWTNKKKKPKTKKTCLKGIESSFVIVTHPYVQNFPWQNCYFYAFLGPTINKWSDYDKICFKLPAHPFDIWCVRAHRALSGMVHWLFVERLDQINEIKVNV